MHCLAKEKERNSFLEQELARKEQVLSDEKPRHKAARSIQTEAHSLPPPEASLEEAEAYISELEA